METVKPSAKEFLWHQMQEDLRTLVPSIASDDRLMCSACGRLLTFEEFSVEHIIPRQAVADDPLEIRIDPDAPISRRSGLTLLCSAPLHFKNKTYANGCNSWKGRFYDSALRAILNGDALEKRHTRITERDIVSLVCAAYLGAVREYGYQIALTASGLLLRQQFFSPNRLLKSMPLSSQMILGSRPVVYAAANADIWRIPFKFTIEKDACLVVIRTFAVRIPISRDPRVPISVHLKIAPAKYKLRPDFRTVFG